MLGFGTVGEFALGELDASSAGLIVIGAVVSGWSDPPPSIRVVLYQSITVPVNVAVAPAEVISVDKWFHTLSEPLRAKASLRPSSQATFFLAEASPFDENITVDRWLNTFSSPVRVPRRLQPGVQLYEALDPYTDVTFSYFQWLSEPVRTKPGLTAANQPSRWLVQSTPFNETAAIDRWHLPLAEPVRVKLGLTAANQFSRVLGWPGPFPELVSIDRWLLPLSEPVRLTLRRGLAARFQPATVLGRPTPTEAITDLRAMLPWSEPVRFRINGRLKVVLAAASGYYPGVDPGSFPIPTPTSERLPLFYQRRGQRFKGRS